MATAARTAGRADAPRPTAEGGGASASAAGAGAASSSGGPGAALDFRALSKRILEDDPWPDEILRREGIDPEIAHRCCTDGCERLREGWIRRDGWFGEGWCCCLDCRSTEGQEHSHACEARWREEHPEAALDPPAPPPQEGASLPERWSASVYESCGGAEAAARGAASVLVRRRPA